MYSDIVIADLSEGNANVFYELGIRHALHKCSTILIIQEGYDIPLILSSMLQFLFNGHQRNTDGHSWNSKCH